MNTRLLSTARRLWCASHVDASTNRLNQLKWARAVARLGDRWLLASQVMRKSVE